ncbi:hypothetical protein HYV57_03895 [Candidatus Peregrinibacteria bacterium]|nr:hypothetical protein [Candidatus Peregrinibacteria bacterium]
MRLGEFHNTGSNIVPVLKPGIQIDVDQEELTGLRGDARDCGHCDKGSISQRLQTTIAIFALALLESISTVPAHAGSDSDLAQPLPESRALLEGRDTNSMREIRSDFQTIGLTLEYAPDLDPVKVFATVRAFHEALRLYPPELVSKLRGYTIRVIENLEDSNGAPIFGRVLVDRIELDLNSNNLPSLVHELSHFFYFYELSHERIFVEQAWANFNPEGIRAYTFSSGVDAILAYQSGRTVPDTPPDGFASWYGKDGGVQEDIAEIEEALTNVSIPRARNFLIRANADSVLRRKIETLTGCRVGNGMFLGDLTPEEYAAVSGFKEFQFYRKWVAVGSNGRHPMDFRYWNARVNGNPHFFDFFTPVVSKSCIQSSPEGQSFSRIRPSPRYFVIDPNLVTFLQQKVMRRGGSIQVEMNGNIYFLRNAGINLLVTDIDGCVPSEEIVRSILYRVAISNPSVVPSSFPTQKE